MTWRKSLVSGGAIGDRKGVGLGRVTHGTAMHGNVVCRPGTSDTLI